MTAKILAAIAATFAMLAMAGCLSPPPVRETIRTVTVSVPVPVPVVPPAELMERVMGPATDVFMAPGGASAVACIDAAGREVLVGYVE